MYKRQVEESEGLDAENVMDYTEKLRAALPPSIRVEYLHGKMRPKEKNERMEQFLRKEIQILVSTTVIEVGVNVPNATVMMVENAERFGLAQLHQLRGRVGRGSHQSYCIFVDGSGDGENNARLKILKDSNDGFRIASEDLKLRGPGDVFGVRQSGNLEFSLGDIFTDSRILQAASDTAEEILRSDPEFTLPEHRPPVSYTHLIGHGTDIQGGDPLFHDELAAFGKNRLPGSHFRIHPCSPFQYEQCS